MPNLYLKWGVFRSLVGSARSDAQIAKLIFGNVEGAAILFSKLLYGDYGCTSEIAGEIAKVMNASIGVRSSEPEPISGRDLLMPVYDFARRLVAVANPNADKLDAAHKNLLETLGPTITAVPAPRLEVKRFQVDRMIGGDWLPSRSDGEDRIIFKPGRHTGQIVVEDLHDDPVAAYTLLTRDPQPIGQRLWDLKWGETVLWLPSPLRPLRVGSTLLLIPAPQPIMPVAGRFHITVVLIFEHKIVGELDPRGADPVSGSLDEAQTARFLTNMRRIAKRKAAPIKILTAEYGVVVEADKADQALAN